MWHLYVPVRIVGTTGVAVAAHAIVAGSVLTANDLRVEQHDMTELPPGYLDDPAIAVGRTAARPISGGTILSNQQLVASKAVQRGQTVTLVADAGGMSVRMAGRALGDDPAGRPFKGQADKLALRVAVSRCDEADEVGADIEEERGTCEPVLSWL